MRNQDSYLLSSVANALTLLTLVRRDGAVTVSAAADALGVARSTAHRLLTTLHHAGYVVQDPARRYLPGPALTALTPQPPSKRSPAHTAVSRMTSLSRELGETVNLMVLAGTQVQFIASVEGTQALRVGSRNGICLPAERTSGGKVLLAERSCAEVDELFTHLLATSEEHRHLHRALAATRRLGYGLNIEQTEPGVVAIAVAVRDAEGVTRAALAVAAPRLRYTRSRVTALVPHLRRCAELIRRDVVTLPLT